MNHELTLSRNLGKKMDNYGNTNNSNSNNRRTGGSITGLRERNVNSAGVTDRDVL